MALTYQPEASSWQTTGDDGVTDTVRVGDATLVALRPGGGSEVLVDAPGEVQAMDVPLDLLESGRFGGPARPPAPFPARPIILLLVVPVVVALFAAVVALRRRYRRLEEIERIRSR